MRKKKQLLLKYEAGRGRKIKPRRKEGLETIDWTESLADIVVAKPKPRFHEILRLCIKSVKKNNNKNQLKRTDKTIDNSVI